METKKIDNLLGDADNESSKFATRKRYVSNDKSNTDSSEGMKIVRPLNLKAKSLNQIFVTIQMHIFL